MNSKKRSAVVETTLHKRHTSHVDSTENKQEDDLIFEDPFGDDLEDEEMIESNDEEEEIIDSNNEQENEENQLSDIDMESKDISEQQKDIKKVYMPGIDAIGEDEELDYDASAYDMYYAMTAEWPALSIDIINDNLGACRTRFPMEMYIVAGTQATKREENQLTVMKLSELHKTKKSNEDSDEEDESDEDDDEMDGEPVLESRSIPHNGGINRVRSMPQSSNIIASWSDTKNVYLWDISKQLESLDGKLDGSLPVKPAPMYTFSGHADEGFAMDWSRVKAGHFVTGDCRKYIYHWQNSNSAWYVDMVPFTGHQSSVEDLQWSVTEATVFASCSSDQTIRIWDTRRKNGSMLDVHAHDDDVNVISWNRNVAYLLASGSDDGSFKIWDLRNFKAGNPIAHFRYHTAPITSIEWHPTDESVLAVAGADNQISIWDMSVEEDTETTAAANTETGTLELPPQLLFIHQGQTDVKELHFHSQCPGVLVSTAIDGFNVFKPANIS